VLRSIKQLYGDKLGATDGDIGSVKDFYFDEENWAIRYLVADTGNWLTSRQVLLSPHSLGRLDQAGKILRVKLTRKQIENSPSIDLHKPVSRQYEEIENATDKTSNPRDHNNKEYNTSRTTELRKKGTPK